MIQKIVRYVSDNKLGVFTIVLCLTYMFLGMPLQVLRIWETRSVEGVSLPMFVLLCLQSVAWVLYGFHKKDWFVIIANSFGTIFSGIIVAEYLTLQYGLL